MRSPRWMVPLTFALPLVMGMEGCGSSTPPAVPVSSPNVVDGGGIESPDASPADSRELDASADAATEDATPVTASHPATDSNEDAAAPPAEVAPPASASSIPVARLAVVMADEFPYVPGTFPSSTPAPAKTPPRKKTRPPKTRKPAKQGTTGRPYHPDPGIIIDVTGAHGAISQAELQRTARMRGYGVVRACYEEGLRRAQDLKGKVMLDLVVKADGKGESATKTNSTLSDSSVALCVVRELMHLTYPTADSSTTAQITVTLVVGDAPVPLPRPVPEAEKLREAFHAKYSAVEGCYRAGLERRRDLGGRLQLRMTIKTTGEIADVAEADSRFADVDVTRCVLGIFRTMKGPRVRHNVQLVYPMHFESTARP